MKHAIDLTRGNILAVLTKLAMPIMATSLIQMAYNLTDMIWIGRLGASAVAAVGSAGMFMWLASGFTTFAPYRRSGHDRTDARRKGAGTCVYVCTERTPVWHCVCTAYTVVLTVFAKPLIDFLPI